MMATILYVGRHSRFSSAVARLVGVAGYRLAICRSHDALQELRKQSCGAMVLSFVSGRPTLELAQRAKELGIPVIVITSRLAEAFRAFESVAHVFLEQPASVYEVAILASELATIRQLAEPLRSEIAAAAAASASGRLSGVAKNPQALRQSESSHG